MAGQATASPVMGIQSLILHGVGDWGNVWPRMHWLPMKFQSYLHEGPIRYPNASLSNAHWPLTTALGAKILMEPDAGPQHPSRFFRCPLSVPGDTTPGGETEAASCTNCCHSCRTRLGARILGN